MIAKVIADEAGNSKIPIPTSIMLEMHWNAGDCLNITKVGKTLHLTKVLEENY